MPEPFRRNVHCLLGLPFDAVDLAEATAIVRHAAADRKRCFLSTPNLNFLIGCLHDDGFRTSVINSDLSIADGMPLIWLASLLRIPIRERVAGSDVFESLRAGTDQKLSVYFFGGPDGAALDACGVLSAEASGLVCAGYQSPGFGTVEELSSAQIVDGINESNADILVVALGARKGQAWLERNRERIRVPVISHLGAVVNFVAGRVARAPGWLQRAGLEWLWRIKEEPALWRRYLGDGVAFLGLVFTRVLPHCYLIIRHEPNDEEIDSAMLKVLDDKTGTSVRLRGPWTQRNLQPLRDLYARIPHITHLRFEMSEVTYVDSAFIGQILLMQRYCRESGVQLSMENCSNLVRRIFRLSCTEHLLTSTD